MDASFAFVNTYKVSSRGRTDQDNTVDPVETRERDLEIESVLLINGLADAKLRQGKLELGCWILYHNHYGT